MPVVIEKVLQPSPQDIIDLNKLYAEYAEGFTYADLQQWLTTTADTVLYGARFNGRLVGAISLQQQQNTIQLNHLCVRAVTRRRGVARDVLRLLLPLYQGHTLSVKLASANIGCETLLKTMGFTQQGLQLTFTS